MPGKPHFNPEEVIAALMSSRKENGSQEGILTRAAIRLGCTRQTIHNYINRYPEVWKAYMQARYNYGINWGPGISLDPADLTLDLYE